MEWFILPVCESAFITRATYDMYVTICVTVFADSTHSLVVQKVGTSVSRHSKCLCHIPETTIPDALISVFHKRNHRLGHKLNILKGCNSWIWQHVEKLFRYRNILPISYYVLISLFLSFSDSRTSLITLRDEKTLSNITIFLQIMAKSSIISVYATTMLTSVVWLMRGLPLKNWGIG